FNGVGNTRCRYNSYSMKEQNPNPRGSAKSGDFQELKRFSHSIVFKVLVLLFIAGCITASGFFVYFYEQDSRVIDRFLGGELFQHTASLYARPYHIYPGQKLRPESVVTRLQRAGYEPSGAKSAENGFYEVSPNKLLIQPSVG